MSTMVTIWDQSKETLEREELAQLQLERLQASLFRAYRNVSFYRKRLDAQGISPEDVQALEQLRTLPFTTKEDLRNGYPYDLLAVPLREVVRLHSSSWSAGRPTVGAYTRNDLRHWNDLVARILSAAGVTRDDVVQIIFGNGALTSSIGFHGGAERIGASVIPTSADGMEQQVALMQDFKTTAIVGTSSDAARLAAAVQEKKLDPRRLSVRVGIFGSEPWSETLRAQIEESLHLTALDHYGLSEVGGPGVAGECPEKCGLHLFEDHFLAEIIDPATGKVVPPGEEGELVLTTLTKEALPLIRFRTHDLTRLDYRRCACGRTLARMTRLTRRTDDLLIIQGKRFYPAQIEATLTAIEGTQPHYQVVLSRKGGMEEMELTVEVSASLRMDTPGKVLAVEQQVLTRIQETTGLSPRVRLVETATFERLAGGNATQVVDTRD